VDDIPGSPNHNGCSIVFGPDGKHYVTMGDGQDADWTQNLESLAGKVLRLESYGSAPTDNPFPGFYVYTYGHRIPQGISWHPPTGNPFITEHGPDKNKGSTYLRPEITAAGPRLPAESEATRMCFQSYPLRRPSPFLGHHSMPETSCTRPGKVI